MLTEGSKVRGLNGQIYTLGPKLGEGGEGAVYDIPGAGIVIKIYKNISADLERKLRYMVMHPVPSLTDQRGNSILRLAWPRDIVYFQQGFVGYAMPKLENALEIFHVVRGCKSPKARQMWPYYTWELNVRVARNLALAVFHLHNSGYVIGDMNDKNILVREDGVVCILDIDSFDFTDSGSGIHYRCGVGLADYLAPELHGRNLSTANFSAQSDDYALAIHIFQLLMDNFHPFTGRRLVQSQNSTAGDQRIQRMVDGICPFVRNVPGYEIPADAPRLEETLPQKLREDFAQTLTYDSMTAFSAISRRTTAEQWAKDLNEFLKTCQAGDLIQCSVDREHYYLRSIGSCGRCAAQRRFAAAQTKLTPQPQPVPRPQSTPQPRPIPQTRPSPSPKKSKSFWVPAVLVAGLIIVFLAMFSKKEQDPYADIHSQVSSFLATMTPTQAATPSQAATPAQAAIPAQTKSNTQAAAYMEKCATISAGFFHSVLVTPDGNVTALGDNTDGQGNVSNWRNITAVSTGIAHTVGLKANGTVVATGDNSDGQCDVTSWKDIAAVSAGSFILTSDEKSYVYSYTVGLKTNGTVVAVGNNQFGQCDVNSWRNIVAICAGGGHTVGVKADGTVVATGHNAYGQCDVSSWRDIVAVSAGYDHTVGLKSDGTVVTTGDNSEGQCSVSGWRSIVAISAGNFHTVSIKSDGTAVATGLNENGQCDVSSWKDIVAISAGGWHTLGRTKDNKTFYVGSERAIERSSSAAQENKSNGNQSTNKTQQCAHNWQEATYTAPKKCTLCGKEEGNVKGYIGSLTGKWEKAVIDNTTTSALVVDTPVKGVLTLTIHMDVEMLHGTKAKKWAVYGRTSGGHWEKIDSINLPGGDGATIATIYPNGKTTYYAFALTPIANGSFSWNWNELWFSDVQGRYN